MQAHDAVSLNQMAASATTHCLTGCAIGEVLARVRRHAEELAVRLRELIQPEAL